MNHAAKITLVCLCLVPALLPATASAARSRRAFYGARRVTRRFVPRYGSRFVRARGFVGHASKSAWALRHAPRFRRIAFAAPASLPVVTKPIKPAVSLRAAPIAVHAITATPEGDTTLVAIAMNGTMRPDMALKDDHLLLTLPNAVPGSELPANLTSGGLVSRMSLSLPDTHTHTLRLDLGLKAPVRATWEETRRQENGEESQSLKSNGQHTMVLRLTPIVAVASAAPAANVRAIGSGLYDVDGVQADVAMLLKSLARDSGANVLLAGTVPNKVTVDLRQVSLEKAIHLITQAANLACHQEGQTFVVGTAADIEAAYPKPATPAPQPPPVEAKLVSQDVYHCRYIVAADLVATLEKAFDKEQLRVALGAGPASPRLDAATTEAVTGIATSKSGTTSGDSGQTTDPQRAHDVLLIGDPKAVASALAFAAKLDVRRAQVRINVTITDIALDAERQLGIKWNFNSLTFGESGPHGIHFGTLTRTPLEAQIAALETSNRAKILAAPTLSLLDGERGYILIGERLLFPKLIGYTPANTPIYDKEEVRVGIYMQVAAQIGADGDITMMIYPQVSTIIGYLQIPNVGSYPQIGTREQQTTIRVHDGERIVVGGLIRNEDVNNIQRVPILSKIPFFGELFTYRQKIKHTSDVVVTITPQILKD